MLFPKLRGKMNPLYGTTNRLFVVKKGILDSLLAFWEPKICKFGNITLSLQQKVDNLSMGIRNKIVLLLSLLWMVPLAYAQELDEVVRPIRNILQLQLGEAKVRDTYLTPQLYSGPELGVNYERWHAWKDTRWASQQVVSATMAMAEDRGAHSETWAGRFGYRYAAHYRWDDVFVSGLTLMTGPYANMEAGFNYNLKMGGSNNPATAQVAVQAGASVAGVWHYRMQGQACSAMLQMQMPLLGYALQPEYGASYYESFLLKSDKNLHHFTSLHNRQDYDFRLTTDLAVSALPWCKNNANSLRLGVGYHIETMDVNEIVTRFSSFDLIIGLVFDHIKYNRQNTNLLKRQVYEAY